MKKPAPTLQTLAAAILAEFGIDGFRERGFHSSIESTAIPEEEVDMFGSGIKLDKALLAKVKRYADLAGYSSVEEFITHALEKEIAQLEEVGLGGRDQEEAERARLHLVARGPWPT